MKQAKKKSAKKIARKRAKRRSPNATPRVRRTNAQLFLDKLGELSNKGEQLIPNRALKEALGWDQARYARIRAELINQEKVIIGKGQGGRIGLAAAPGSKSLAAFISYTHADESFKSELVKHLKPLERLGLIKTWHDRQIKAGEEWAQEISKEMDQSDLILLLVSIDFINSEYCYDVELERALERHENGEATVIPIILRNCMWQKTPFAKLQALPKDARAVSLWPDRDDAFVNVAEGVRKVAEQLLSNEKENG